MFAKAENCIFRY